jgi:hypothetical protein
MKITFTLLILAARTILGQPGTVGNGIICGSVLNENGSPASDVRHRDD